MERRRFRIPIWVILALLILLVLVFCTILISNAYADNSIRIISQYCLENPGKLKAGRKLGASASLINCSTPAHESHYFLKVGSGSFVYILNLEGKLILSWGHAPTPEFMGQVLDDIIETNSL